MDSETAGAVAALARHDIKMTINGDMARVEVDGRAVERRWVTGVNYPPPDASPRW